MEGLWWLGTNNELSFNKEMDIPKICLPGDVKIKVAYAGVCGSDFHYMSGQMGKFAAKNDGVIMGHEFSGTVEAVGDKAKDAFKVGDQVCINPNGCCGDCDWDKEGFPHFCAKNKCVGVKRNGGWAQYCVVDQELVYKLPEGVSLEQGALGEPYSCALRGWRMIGTLPPKESRVLIQGAGIIGSLFCTLFHLNGFKNVTVAEISEGRRKLCADMKLGFDVVHPQELDLKFNGQNVDDVGFHLIVDCTGNNLAVQKTFDFIRRGGKLLLFGCCPAGKKIEIEPFQIFWKELTIVGSFINPLCFDDTMELLGKLSQGNYLEYGKLGVKTYPLQKFEEGFATLKSGNASKVVFKLK